MYLRGMQALGQDYEGYYETEPDYSDIASASTTGPTQSYDWTGLVSTALKTWGSYETAKLQSETAVQLAPYQQPKILSPYTTSPRPTTSIPGYSPFPGTGAGGTLFGMSMTTLLILAAAGAGAFFLLRK